MKVGTDGVLLGAWVALGAADRLLLDVGTGTGVIALMLAQRSPAAGVTALDIDAACAEQARANADRSPWGGRVTTCCAPVQKYRPEEPFDLVVSNPPYYDRSLLPPDAGRTTARHTVALTHGELIAAACRLLAPEGRLAVILPVLSVMGCQPVALPTVVLSTHTGGLGTPARLDGAAYGLAALKHYRELGVEFDCIYTGYLGGEEQVALAEKAFDLWPAARKVVDPVMGDNGKAYSTVTPALIDRMRGLCRRADLILPNATEAALLLEREPQTDAFDDASAQALADELLTLAPSAVVTGLALGKYIGCAGSGRERFVIKKLHISRSFPGTGDLYGAVLIGSLIQGNALSAAADNAAEFVSLAIQQTPADQDTRYGVWFEPLLPRLCPVSWND